MDDPGLAWPAWKFGMKRDDLYTTLHDRYNTFTYTLQDPEAFHHDVYEVSRDADTTEEFHRLLSDRQRQRISELHESLQSLAVEIIANPKLMASDQWQYALQLFRTKSFDSIVRFFASYLPDDYDSCSSASSSYSTYSTDNDVMHSPSSEACSADDAPIFHTCDDEFLADDGVVLDESLFTTQADHCDDGPGYDGPLSPPQSEPESEACSDAESPKSYASTTNPPSRSMSFSGSDSGLVGPGLIRSSLIRDEDETSQSDDCDTAVTSVCDASECRSNFDPAEKELVFHVIDDDEDEDLPTTQYPEDDDFNTFDICDSFHDTLNSETATPKADAINSCYIDYQSVLSRRLPSSSIRRSPSPSPRSHQSTHRRETSPLREVHRSPQESCSKIQKPSTEAARRRPKTRTRLA